MADRYAVRKSGFLKVILDQEAGKIYPFAGLTPTFLVADLARKANESGETVLKNYKAVPVASWRVPLAEVS